MTLAHLTAVPPGSRGRIGLIQPAPGLMLEAEWARVLPDGVAAPVTRVPLTGAGLDAYRVMGERAPAAAATLANAGCGAIAYACGVGSLYQGPEAEAALCGALSEAADGVPVVGMAAASLDALRRLSARRVALATPYDVAINDLATRYLEAAGLRVLAVRRFDCASPVAAAGLAPEAILRTLVEARAAAPEAECLWLPCSNVPTLGILDALEARLGLPVVSANLALLWRMLRQIGVADRPVESALLRA